MPETETLDLTAQDVTEAAWDELTRAMFDGEGPQFPARSSDPVQCSSGGISCVSSSGGPGGTSCNCGGGGCHHITS
jgi:hypothetical protein